MIFTLIGFQVAWPPPAGIGRHNDASSTNKMIKTKWAKTGGDTNNIADFAHYASFCHQNGPSFCFHHFGQFTFANEKYCGVLTIL